MSITVKASTIKLSTYEAVTCKAATPFALLFLVCLFTPTFAFAQVSQKSDSQQGTQKLFELWTPGDKGQRMRIRGRVTGADGKPIPNVKIHFRHADADRLMVLINSIIK